MLSSALKTGDFAKLLDSVPKKVRLDVVQMALDIVGIFEQSGVADATSGFISLLRGDLVGFAISAASILPIGDIAKVGKFGKYASSMKELVAIALKNPTLAWSLRKPLRQIKDALNGLGGLMGDSKLTSEAARHLDDINGSLNRYFKKITVIEKIGWEKAARKSGRSGGQYVGHKGEVVTVNGLVDLLANSGKSGSKAIRDEAEELLGKMALSDSWKITAGVHKTSVPAKKGVDATKKALAEAGKKSKLDRTDHITVLIDGIEGAFHVRLNKKGHIFNITHGKKGVSLSTLPK